MRFYNEWNENDVLATSLGMQPLPRRTKGRSRQAKILTRDMFERALTLAGQARCPESGRLKLLLSYYAGLRANEIASLTIDAVTDGDGRISRTIWISDEVSKNGRGRHIPMHPRIQAAIIKFRERYPDRRHLAVGTTLGGLQSANCVSHWFRRLYQRAALTGCSSHSGRRSFATNVARQLAGQNASLRDLQLLMGHARINTTETYIEPSYRLDALIQSLHRDDHRNSDGPIGAAEPTSCRSPHTLPNLISQEGDNR